MTLLGNTFVDLKQSSGCVTLGPCPKRRVWSCASMVECLPYVRSQVLSLNTGRKAEKEEEMEGERKEGKQKGKTQDTQRQAQKESPGMVGA